MPSLIEFITADLSEATFFKELCFSGQKFVVAETGEFELADVFIWLESDGIIIQVKERDEHEPADQSAFDKWFQRKVQGKGSDQIADTLALFKKHPSVTVRNARGLEFELRELGAATMHNLVIFGTLTGGVDQHHKPKFRISERSGFIHVIQAVDFSNLLKWTVTPGEMLEYLGFREQVVQQWEVANQRTEKWLFGCFVHWSDSGRDPECLDEAEAEAKVDGLVDDTVQANVQRFLDLLGSWAATTGNPRDFARIVVEIAHMPRSLAREFKVRIQKCVEHLDTPFPFMLYRLYNWQRDCLFMLTVSPGSSVEEREQISGRLLLAARYGARTQRAVGLFFAGEGEDIGITPVFCDEPWKKDDKGEAAIAEFPILARLMKKKPGRAYSVKDDSSAGQDAWGLTMDTGSNRVDALVVAAKGVLGAVPVVGPIIAEVVGTIIPNQRIDRIARLIEFLHQKVAGLDQGAIEQRMRTPEAVDLLEDGFQQAARALSDERLEYIAGVLKKGLTDEHTEQSETKLLMWLLGQISDAEVIVLTWLDDPWCGWSEGFVERHRAVLQMWGLDGAPPTNIEEKAIHGARREHLVNLGLLHPMYKGAGPRTIPEFDYGTGKLKATGYELTLLGHLLVETVIPNSLREEAGLLEKEIDRHADGEGDRADRGRNSV